MSPLTQGLNYRSACDGSMMGKAAIDNFMCHLCKFRISEKVRLSVIIVSFMQV